MRHEGRFRSRKPKTTSYLLLAIQKPILINLAFFVIFETAVCVNSFVIVGVQSRHVSPENMEMLVTKYIQFYSLTIR